MLESEIVKDSSVFVQRRDMKKLINFTASKVHVWAFSNYVRKKTVCVPPVRAEGPLEWTGVLVHMIHKAEVCPHWPNQQSGRK